MSKQDRQGARTPADLERRYGFEKRFAEVTGIATDARNEAEEAKKVAASVKETDDGLAIQVKALDEEMVAVKAELEMKVSTDEDGNVTSKMHIGADTLTIDTDNFELSEKGEIAARKGLIGGWVIDEFGIHPSHGLKGTFTIVYSGSTLEETYTGYLFYCLAQSGIYLYIFEEDSVQLAPPLWLGNMLGNYTIKAEYDDMMPANQEG